jgi:hypothetical protein
MPHKRKDEHPAWRFLVARFEPTTLRLTAASGRPEHMCFQWSREERTGVYGAPVAHNLVKNLVKFCSRSRPWRNKFRAINSRNQFPAFEEGSQIGRRPSQ